MEIEHLRNVFNAGGEPTFTYIKRDNHTKKLEEKISDELYSSKVIIIHGPSKLGKTVIAKKIFADNEHFWIDGGVVKNALGVWKTILMISDSDYATNYFIPQIDEENAQLTANLVLSKQKKPFIIDDFHLLPEEEQKKIVQSIKSLVYNNIPVVFICVPHKIVDIVNAEREMNSRYTSIEIPIWKKNELNQIAIEGFKELNISYNQSLIDNFINNSFGSPFIMQEICYNACLKDKDIITRVNNGEQLQLESPFDKISDRIFYGNIAETYATDEFKWVLNGTKSYATSQKRVLVETITGEKIDTFEVVKRALALSKIDEPIEYSYLKDNIKSILTNEPDWSRITHVLNKINSLAHEIAHSHDPVRDPILEWNNESKILNILDPFLKFYIKWGS